MHRRYTWRPSPPDPRNFVTEVSGAKPPAEYDPRSQADAPSVVDQLQIGSCTANAFRTALRRALLIAGKDTGEVSRLHIYGGERTMEGSFPEDAGAIGHDSFKFARKQGIAHEEAWPYGDGSSFDSQTDYRTAQAASGKVRITQYSHPHPDADTFKAVLSSGRYICFGFNVYEKFESKEVDASGIVPLPRRGEQLLGGHEVCAVGYLNIDGDLYFICQNSWGTSWAQDGFFLMPEAYVFGFGTSDWRCIDAV
jgi:C1A family cysteine protease